MEERTRENNKKKIKSDLLPKGLTQGNVIVQKGDNPYGQMAHNGGKETALKQD